MFIICLLILILILCLIRLILPLLFRLLIRLLLLRHQRRPAAWPLGMTGSIANHLVL